MAKLPLTGALLVSIVLTASPTYVGTIEGWRKDREQNLKSPTGWLTVAGLFWLKEGENRIGSDQGYEVVLPEGRAPQRIGVFDFHAGKTSFRAAAGAHVQINGKAALTGDMKPDTSGKPDLLQMGDFTMFVIERGGRYAIRLRDLHSKMRTEFKELHWYPIRESHRVVAKFVSHHQPQKIAIPNILGQTEYQPSPGYATFQLMGHTYRLDPIQEDDQLFFIFRDLTSGKTTYGAGRFLYADMPKEGKVVLDFNKAYNPPCAFTPYATCPLPPKQNRMPVKIEAGELKYSDH